MTDLPAGYVLDGAPAQTAALPDGYVLDGQAATKPASWAGALKALGNGSFLGGVGMLGAPGDLAKALGAGVSYAGDKLGFDPAKVDAAKSLFNTAAKGNPLLAPFAINPGSGAILKKIEDAAGPMSKPDNGLEQHIQDVAAFIPAAVAGPEGVLPNILKRGILPGVTSDAAGTVAKNVDPSLEGPARFVGALAAPFGGVKNAAGAAPTAESVAAKIADADAAAAQGFDAARNSGVGIKASSVADMAAQAREAMRKRGGRDNGHMAPSVYGFLKELENADPRAGADLGDVHGMRMALGDMRKVPGPESTHAGILADHLDSFLHQLPDNPQHLVIDGVDWSNPIPRTVHGDVLPEADHSLPKLPPPSDFDAPIAGDHPAPAVIDPSVNGPADALKARAESNDAAMQEINRLGHQQRAQEGVTHLTNAIGDYAAARQSERVMDAIGDADRSAAAANSGMNVGNRLRQTFDRFVKGRAVQGRGLTDSERAAVNSLIMRGAPGAQKYRLAGNLLGGGGGIAHTALAGTGAIVDGGVGALSGAGLGVLGSLARRKYNGMVMDNALGIADSVANRAPSLADIENALPALRYSKARSLAERVLRAGIGANAVFNSR
jgi:hypothetical protein